MKPESDNEAPDPYTQPLRLEGALGELERGFLIAGAEKQARLTAEAEQRRARRRAVRWPAFGAVLGFLLVGGGVAAVGTDVFTADGGSTGRDPGAPTETRHAAKDARRGLAVAADPLRRNERWGVGVFPSANGRETCVLAGMIRGGGLGHEQNGKFLGFDATFPGRCDDVSVKHFVFRTRTYGAAAGSRTLLFGYADRSVTAVRLGPPGRATTIPVADDGTFIVVKAKPDALRGQTFQVDGSDTHVSFRLQREHVPVSRPKP